MLILIKVYEVKHSKEVAFDLQSKFLNNDELVNSFGKIYGEITDRSVLYNGSDISIHTINLINIFLFNECLINFCCFKLLKKIVF